MHVCYIRPEYRSYRTTASDLEGSERGWRSLSPKFTENVHSK